MSRAQVDLSVLPIDVGFDLRLHGILVSVPADTTSAAYDDAGIERTVRGTPEQIVAALQSAGYECVLATARAPRIA